MAQLKNRQAYEQAINERWREKFIVARIRERYTLDDELALNRKKNMGTVDPAKWDAYCSYVEECIKVADDLNNRPE